MLDNSHPLPPNRGAKEIAKLNGCQVHSLLNVPIAHVTVNVRVIGYTFKHGRY